MGVLDFVILLTACTSHPNGTYSALDKYEIVYAATHTDSACEDQSGKQQATVSFSNEWNDSVVVVVNDNKVFDSRIVTEGSTAVTGKGFTLNGEKYSIDTINVFIVNEKRRFRFNVNYLYSYIKLYKVGDSVRVYETNCTTLLY